MKVRDRGASDAETLWAMIASLCRGHGLCRIWTRCGRTAWRGCCWGCGRFRRRAGRGSGCRSTADVKGLWSAAVGLAGGARRARVQGYVFIEPASRWTARCSAGAQELRRRAGLLAARGPRAVELHRVTQLAQLLESVPAGIAYSSRDARRAAGISISGRRSFENAATREWRLNIVRSELSTGNKPAHCNNGRSRTVRRARRTRQACAPAMVRTAGCVCASPRRTSGWTGPVHGRPVNAPSALETGGAGRRRGTFPRALHAFIAPEVPASPPEKRSTTAKSSRSTLIRGLGDETAPPDVVEFANLPDATSTHDGSRNPRQTGAPEST